MSNLVPLDQGQLPAYVSQLPVGDLAAGFGTGDIPNKISLKNGQFRMIRSGEEIQATPNPLNVIIHGINSNVSRIFYEGQYDASAKARGPDCMSEDGVTPLEGSPKKQATSCAVCPMNEKSVGGRKQCKYFKRIVVSLLGDDDQELYILDAASLSMFGDDYPQNNMYNLKNYANLLASRKLPSGAVVTQVIVDTQASVSKMLFSPAGVMPQDYFEFVQSKVDKEKAEEWSRVTISGTTAANTGEPAQAAAPVAPAPVAMSSPPAAAPAAAPAPVATPVEMPSAPAPAPAAQATPTPSEVSEIDSLLDDLTS